MAALDPAAGSRLAQTRTQNSSSAAQPCKPQLSTFQKPLKPLLLPFTPGEGQFVPTSTEFIAGSLCGRSIAAIWGPLKSIAVQRQGNDLSPKLTGISDLGRSQIPRSVRIRTKGMSVPNTMRASEGTSGGILYIDPDSGPLLLRMRLKSRDANQPGWLEVGLRWRHCVTLPIYRQWGATLLAGDTESLASAAGGESGGHSGPDRLAYIPPHLCDASQGQWRRYKDRAGTSAACKQLGNGESLGTSCHGGEAPGAEPSREHVARRKLNHTEHRAYWNKTDVRENHSIA